jgi:hypothetical protein
MYVPREAIELRNYENRPMKPTEAKRLSDGRPVIALPAFDLDYFLNQ